MIKKKLLGSSPKTSILGLLKGLFVALIPIFQKDGFSFQKDWMYLVGAILLYLGGRFQKDSDGIDAKQDQLVESSVMSGDVPPTTINKK